MMQQFSTSPVPGASPAIRLFARHAGLVVAALLCLSFGRAEVPLRERVHVPAIMKRLYEHRALEGCDSQSPVFSILANGSADSMIIDFNTTHDDNVDVERTRLSLDMPRECLVAPRPPLELKATSSGWTGTRQLHFRRRGASHKSPRRRSGSSPGNGLCRRTKLYVEFRDMGWGEWIVAPTGYWAHQCEGSCAFPMSANMNVTNHAAVKSLMHSMTTAGVRAPCCVPVKLAPQNLLYIDSYDHVVLKTFPEMTVADCGCR
ncbi:bone morphogenetic protein, putative [Ixodes scapularis]|uniref:Bone morphogenetic protein, putative n=1 Tax=Ixodes scapularis TaxID=6945 RepID=B7Q502_IXOSC|nr:bone morphogenetic protein, putative [Ixodes scapularis]|eukprot:XP_002411660.1 bone morphogenetic protein, putative [Ixodes scapularis]